jgi:hypothetical protein
MIKMRVCDEHMVDQGQLRQRQFANTGAGVYKDILINQKRSRSMLLAANAARAAEYAQAHDGPDLNVCDRHR